MALIQINKKCLDGEKIEYYCSNCNKLIANIFRTNNCSVALDFPNNCFNCNEKITQPVTTYVPIIYEIKYE